MPHERLPNITALWIRWHRTVNALEQRIGRRDWAEEQATEAFVRQAGDIVQGIDQSDLLLAFRMCEKGDDSFLDQLLYR